MNRCSFPLLFYLLGLSDGINNLSQYRLPTKTYPVKYSLTLDLTQPELDTFRAQSGIIMNVTEKKTTDFTFSVNPQYINLTSMVVEESTDYSYCELNKINNFTKLMGVSCKQNMCEENCPNLTTIKMYYQASYSNEEPPSGLYKHIFAADDTESWVIYTEFRPTHFRSVFPSLDEPTFKTPMHLVVEHHINLTVVSNMEAMDTLKKGDFLQNTSFKDTPKMSTYLLAMVAGPNDTWREYVSPQNQKYSFSVFAQRIFEDNLSIVMETGPKLLDLMGKWNNLPYETLGNTKMTVAALPGKQRATENWGLLLLGEEIIVDEGSRTTEISLENIVTVIAHELSNQWFGNYVTLTWWSELWLHEGFATFFQYYLGHMLSEGLGLDKTFVIKILQAALEVDGPDKIPLSNKDENINSEQEIEDVFNTDYVIPNEKGASILRMIQYTLGDHVFQKACQNYLQKNALGNTRASNFIQELQNALSTESHQPNLSVYLDAWIHEPSFPVLKTSRSKDESGNVTITINVYKFNTAEESIWYVPLTYVTSENLNEVETAWINPGSTFNFTMSDSNDSWFVINVDARGFYRVEYDSESISRIAKILNNPLTYDIIPVLSRAQILDDIFALASVYNRSHETAFSVASYLKHEKEYYPWYTLWFKVALIFDTIQNATKVESINNKMLSLVESQLVIPEGQSSKNFSHSEILKRNLLLDWACLLNQKDALNYVKSQYQNYKINNTSIDNDFREVIICHGIRASPNSTEEFHNMLQLYISVVNPQEKKDITAGMSCLEKDDISTSYLESAAADKRSIEKAVLA